MQTFDRPSIKDEAKRIIRANRSPFIMASLAMVLALVVLATVSFGILAIVLSGMVYVTAAGFFLNGWRETMVTISEAVSDTFDNNFLRKVGGMLWRNLLVFLWSLLFFFPGVIMALSYALTPFILYDCPNVLAMDACRLSAKMMRGHRMELLIAHLSFLGWDLLSVMTLGLLDMLYVKPYKQLTFAGIYEELKNLALDGGVVTQDELDGKTAVL